MDPEIAVYESLGKEILKRVNADETATDILLWLQEWITSRSQADSAMPRMPWSETFPFTDTMLAQFEALSKVPEADRKVLTWPWQSWESRIDHMEPGMLAVVTAPDGGGKTVYAESISEHWARHKHHVVFVHYELNRKLMMLRRLARHTSIDSRSIKEWRLTPMEVATIQAVRPRLEAWEGCITYLHTPAWSMERTVSELRNLRAEGLCDVAVIDYLEKAAPSNRQVKLFGTNPWQREADNVEQLKNFAELTETPVLMLAQMSKAGKGTSFKDMDRTDMRGAGEKSEKSNLVVMLHREKDANDIDVRVDKQNMGPTGNFRQYMRPEFYQVADIEEGS